jgi:hypothetical protein
METTTKKAFLELFQTKVCQCTIHSLKKSRLKLNNTSNYADITKGFVQLIDLLLSKYKCLNFVRMHIDVTRVFYLQ